MKAALVADFLFTAGCCALIVAGILGLGFSPLPMWLGRTLFVLSTTLLAASLLVAYSYAAELFVSYYSGDPAFRVRATSVVGVGYLLLFGSTLIPQLFWFSSLRSRPLPVLLIALAAATSPLIKHLIVSRRS